MAPASHVKPLVAPLLARNADLVLVGRLVVIRPIHHILRGILIDRRGDPDRFQPMWFAYPLFCAGPEYYLSWSYNLGPGGDRVWLHSEPHAAEELSARIEGQVLPTLRAITTIAGFERFAQKHPQSHHMLDWLDHRPPLSVAQGDLASASRYCTEKIAPLQVASYGRDEEDKTKLRQLKELCRRLSLDDRAGLAALLHEWEATLVRDLKIAHFWEPTPFPLEQEGTRS